jgi:endonuclease G
MADLLRGDRRFGSERSIDGVKAPELVKLRQAVMGKKPDPDDPGISRRVAGLAAEGQMVLRRDLERVLGYNDLVEFNYLERGLLAGRSVGRIVELGGGDVRPVGTGFLVAPGVMMTNWHVLETAAEAARCAVEFGYENDFRSKPRSSTFFRFMPDRYFWSTQELDFALVAVAPAAHEGKASLESFGYLKLNGTPGKARPKEFLTVIQHPNGQAKQISIRENQLLEYKEHVILYASDTAPGSSGSPVFNDVWQVVALHHRSVAKESNGKILDVDGKVATDQTPDSRIAWIANEGVRISAIVSEISARAPAGEPRDLVLAAGDVPEPRALEETSRSGAGEAETTRDGSDLVIRVPVTLRVRLDGAGLPDGVATGPKATAALLAPAAGDGAHEKLRRNPRTRKGYKEDFIPGFRVALPTLSAAKKRDAAPLLPGKGTGHLLHYHHFSLAVSKSRRMCMLAASNVDRDPALRSRGRKAFGSEDWEYDDRILREYQIDENELYEPLDYDRGHIVMREDAAWGATPDEEEFANADTYSWANCAPQRSGFNKASSKDGNPLWGDLEARIMKQQKRGGIRRACVFAGPIFGRSDPEVDTTAGRSVHIPLAFWKVIVVASDDDRQLETYAFELEHDVGPRPDEALADLEKFEVGEFVSKMVSVAALQRKIGLTFPAAVRKADQAAAVKKAAKAPAKKAKTTAKRKTAKKAAKAKAKKRS